LVEIRAPIRRWLDPRWRFTHIASGEYRDPVTAGRLQRLGVVAGWPDLAICRTGSTDGFP
jgi:hypothetical protein